MERVRTFAGLEEVRAEIDRLDRAIVPLIAARLALAQEAVRFKSSDDDVRAPHRVAEVIANVRKLARECGGDESGIEQAYRGIVGVMIDLEMANCLDRHNS